MLLERSTSFLSRSEYWGNLHDWEAGSRADSGKVKKETEAQNSTEGPINWRLSILHQDACSGASRHLTHAPLTYCHVSLCHMSSLLLGLIALCVLLRQCVWAFIDSSSARAVTLLDLKRQKVHSTWAVWAATLGKQMGGYQHIPRLSGWRYITLS